MTAIIIIAVIVYYCNDFKGLGDIKKIILSSFKKEDTSKVKEAINSIIKNLPRNSEEYDKEYLIESILNLDNNKMKKNLEKLLGIRVILGDKNSIIKTLKKFIKLFRRKKDNIDHKLIDSILKDLAELYSEQ